MSSWTGVDRVGASWIFGQKTKCPYCFDEIREEDVVYRCSNRAGCTKEDDGVLGRFYSSFGYQKGSVALEPVVQQAPKKRFRQAPLPVCPTCKQSTTIELCPHCHMELPDGWTQARGRVIAMVGNRSSGKTILTHVLLHEMERQFPTLMGAAVVQLDSMSRERFNRVARDNLYRYGQLPGGTVRLSDDAEVRFPFCLRFSWGRTDIRQQLNLAVYDVAGEDYENDDALRRDARYISRADAVIVLIDPTQLDALSALLDSTIPPGTPPQEGLARLAGVMRAERGVGIRKQLSAPIAVVMTKIDALGQLMGDSPLFSEEPMTDGYRAETAEAISADVERRLAEWTNGGLAHFVNQQFKTSRYFGVSALGGAAVSTGSGLLRIEEGVNPLRVLEPLLWILDLWGYGRRPVDSMPNGR